KPHPLCDGLGHWDGANYEKSRITKRKRGNILFPNNPTYIISWFHKFEPREPTEKTATSANDAIRVLFYSFLKKQDQIQSGRSVFGLASRVFIRRMPAPHRANSRIYLTQPKNFSTYTTE